MNVFIDAVKDEGNGRGWTFLELLYRSNIYGYELSFRGVQPQEILGHFRKRFA